MFRQFPYTTLLAASVLAAAAMLADHAGPTVSAQTAAPQNQTTLDDQTELARHGLQLGHRSCSGRAQPPASAGHVRPPVHGHRGHGQSRPRCTSDR